MLGLNIQLERNQKIQLGACAAIFLFAGIMTCSNWDRIAVLFGRIPPDKTVTSWVETHKVGVVPTKPITADNPVDPLQCTTVRAFAGRDGKLLIIEHPQNPVSQPKIVFVPDRRRKNAGDFRQYRDELAKVAAIHDEARRAITFAAYMAAENRPLGLLNAAKLTPDQRKDEKTARDAMMLALQQLDNQVYDGTFESSALQSILDMAAKYDTNKDDPLSSPAKQDMARQIMDAGLKYLAKIDDAKALVIQKYVDALDQMLQGDQRQKLADTTRDRLAKMHGRIG
jgi:hypothetical protein